MRQLIGKIRDKRNVIEEVFASEQVRCRECERAVPMGIEVIVVQKGTGPRKILRRACYCRAHGSEFISMAQSW
jgi:hypothetical protein